MPIISPFISLPYPPGRGVAQLPGCGGLTRHRERGQYPPKALGYQLCAPWIASCPRLAILATGPGLNRIGSGRRVARNSRLGGT
jgi:hypothetical protein